MTIIYKIEFTERAKKAFDKLDRALQKQLAAKLVERSRNPRVQPDKLRKLPILTHSSQVAARGGVHLLIAKASTGTFTRTGVRPLDDAERREEIVGMLSGAEVADEARAQAGRLLEAA